MPVPAPWRHLQAPRWVDASALDVRPDLHGLPLAAPGRRAAAMALDLMCVALLATVEGPWLIGGLVLVAGLLARRRLPAPRAWAGWAFVALLGVLLADQAWDRWTARSSARSQATASAAASAAASASASAPVPAPAAEDPDDTDADATLPTPTGASAASPEQRIAALQAEVERLRRPQPWKWRKQLRRALDEVGLSLGWGVVYFSLLPAWWNGQTVGKRWFKLRTVELTGRPLTVMRSLRRYGGYAAGMATGGLGFLQALWDVNRQGIQDRVAHTVVVDLRGPALAPRAPGPAAGSAAAPVPAPARVEDAQKP